jgi:hypothetical protein
LRLLQSCYISLKVCGQHSDQVGLQFVSSENREARIISATNGLYLVDAYCDRLFSTKFSEAQTASPFVIEVTQPEDGNSILIRNVDTNRQIYT